MAVTVQQITAVLEELAPKRLAEEWDNVGLQIGDYKQKVDKLLVSLDVNGEVLKEAVKREVDLIIAHHPFIFKGISNIKFNTARGKIIKRAIMNNISLYVAHTNYDIARGGLNDLLAEKLKLIDLNVLKVTEKERLKKLVVFVPEEAVEEVRTALGEAGAGWIGNYSHCAFQQEGTGTFKPLPGSDPYIGKQGEVSKVAEYRLETIVPEGKLSKVLNKMYDSHPYEEVAYDIYPVENRGQIMGLGRIGRLERKISLKDYAEVVKDELDLETVKVTGDLDKKVKKVALCSGSGADLIEEAIARKADLLITGDVKYHEAQRAEERGLAIIDAGHYGTEKIMEEGMANYLREKTNNRGLEVEIIEAKIYTNPWQLI